MHLTGILAFILGIFGLGSMALLASIGRLITYVIFAKIMFEPEYVDETKNNEP
jgi:hypothetical protein